MAITHPHLATELLPNNFGRAEEMVAGTKNKLPWKCSICEHQWEAQGWSRAYQGTGCPACSNKGLHSDGSNSMAVTHPRLARELMANEYGTAEELIAGTSKRLPWKCSICEHQWETTGNNRTISSNCPACVNQEFHSSGLNSIASKLPEIAHELLPNPHGTAETLIYVTGINLPWKCSTCGHEWKTTGRNRERGSGCGPCNRGGLKSDGSNSMILTHPYLAKELLPNRHGDSNTLIATTNKKLPWKCLACGFEWITSGAHRVYDGTGCSQCATHGFQPHLPAQYYVHEILNSFGDVIYYKGGISGDWVIRLTRLKSDLPDHLSYNNIEVVHFNHGDDARELERNLLEVEAIRAPKRDFSGGTELFTSNPLEYARELNLLQPDK